MPPTGEQMLDKHPAFFWTALNGKQYRRGTWPRKVFQIGGKYGIVYGGVIEYEAELDRDAAYNLVRTLNDSEDRQSARQADFLGEV